MQCKSRMWRIWSYTREKEVGKSVKNIYLTLVKNGSLHLVTCWNIIGRKAGESRRGAFKLVWKKKIKLRLV